MKHKNQITPSNTSVQMLFALLRASLNEKECPHSFSFKEASNEDWYLYCKLATEQGVMVLAWDGGLMLPKALQPLNYLGQQT